MRLSNRYCYTRSFKTNHPHFDGHDTTWFENMYQQPLYFIVAKKKIIRLKMMSPDEYFEIISKNFGITVEECITYVEQWKVDMFADNMKKGDKFPIPYYGKDTSEQEGRHRVLAAKKLGCKELPVIELEYLSTEWVTNFIEANKYKTKEELNEYFISLGFQGVTELGMRDLELYSKIGVR
jgi:hypothetical protein